MNPEDSKPFLIGPATLVNATPYPSALGARIDRMLTLGDQNGAAITLLVGGAATFGTATLQRQVSFDEGVTWINDGAAISTAALVAVTFARAVKYRWLVTGSGNITVAALYVA